MRAEFPAAVKEVLARRAGYRCSNPPCSRPTAGPAEPAGSTVNIGVAAHVTAASEGGPRFNPGLSAEERVSVDNGIWLCQTCAKLVDSDPTRFTVRLLRGWREVAEEMARASLADPRAEQRAAQPLEFSRLSDPEATKITEHLKAQGYVTAVVLSNDVDSRLRRGFELGRDPETGREIHFVFQAGAIREESVLLVKPKDGRRSCQ